MEIFNTHIVIFISFKNNQSFLIMNAISFAQQNV